MAIHIDRARGADVRAIAEIERESFSDPWSERSFHDRLVASEKVATRLPPDVDRTSGSFPRLPISITLFRLRLTNSSWRVGLGSRRERCHPTDRDTQSILRTSSHF